MPNTEYLTLAGVPVILDPPAKQRSKAPLILLWHGFCLPNSEEMLAETFIDTNTQSWYELVIAKFCIRDFRFCS